MHELGQVIERFRARLQAAADAEAANTGTSAAKLSNRELSRRSGVHWSTISYMIETGEVGKPEFLGDLARIFADRDQTADDVLAELQAAAGLPVGAGLEWPLPSDIQMFGTRTRAAFENLMRAYADDILEAHGKRRMYGRVLRAPQDDGEDRGGQADAK